jgi:hypothetical protein
VRLSLLHDVSKQATHVALVIVPIRVHRRCIILSYSNLMLIGIVELKSERWQACWTVRQVWSHRFLLLNRQIGQEVGLVGGCLLLLLVHCRGRRALLM